MLQVAGVASADPHIVRFGNWTRPDGALDGILLVGLDLESGLGRPWQLGRGRVEDLEAVISAVAGYALGMALAKATSVLSQRGTPAILLPWPLTVALYGIKILGAATATAVLALLLTRPTATARAGDAPPEGVAPANAAPATNLIVGPGRIEPSRKRSQ